MPKCCGSADPDLKDCVIFETKFKKKVVHGKSRENCKVVNRLNFNILM